MKKYITLLSLLFVGIPALGADDLKPLEPNSNRAFINQFRQPAVPARMINGKVVFYNEKMVDGKIVPIVAEKSDNQISSQSALQSNLTLSDLVRLAEKRKTNK